MPSQTLLVLIVTLCLAGLSFEAPALGLRIVPYEVFLSVHADCGTQLGKVHIADEFLATTFRTPLGVSVKFEDADMLESAELVHQSSKTAFIKAVTSQTNDAWTDETGFTDKACREACEVHVEAFFGLDYVKPTWVPDPVIHVYAHYYWTDVPTAMSTVPEYLGFEVEDPIYEAEEQLQEYGSLARSPRTAREVLNEFVLSRLERDQIRWFGTLLLILLCLAVAFYRLPWTTHLSDDN
ncbi:uncharacterized protein L969DRAFT_93010 [Mixia osmundae IAM 14324]|uniref:GOLD domain-containing protein n=1 Tax=Mixia osmundae (strain CBS 9802 / IAM 14324 / JCM 22182 / KY 12970) TaxID=764103 RepID=G7E6D5_MIXOS|nr:uncharacterized protein L969DRAFT_93010 [Mixia osmundae IAM 14324]KEI40448.1 hypothetical protein L969DRAFT_93010 [Mixia osmundae IAM 14324]GAA98395.1 hypothetical protein E5Q_05081 [Mixia osmundae IAM 14324]